jgi:hypothetical protein
LTMKSTPFWPTFWGQLATAVAATAVLAIAQRAEAQSVPKNEIFADFLFIVDESGSMYAGHDWLDEMIYELEAKLQGRGLGTGQERNRYGLVGFGNRAVAPRAFDLDPFTPGEQLFGSADQFAQTSLLLERSGGFEDGYAGIQFGLDTYEFRPRAAVNFVLVSDEDRDIFDRNLSFQSILNNLQAQDALLNVVVNHRFQDADGNRVVGADGWGNAFIPDGDSFRTGMYAEPSPASPSSLGVSSAVLPMPKPGETLLKPILPVLPPPIVRPPVLGPVLPPITPPVLPPVVPPWPGETTREDYVELAWASEMKAARGAAWDLNLLRPGGGTVSAFTDAFTTIKAEEAYRQSVPEPGSLLGLILLGLGSLWGKGRAATREQNLHDLGA